jgi:hypothetical protein
MNVVKMEHDSDSESYSTSSRNEENGSGTQSDEVPVLLVAEVRQCFMFF